MFRRDWIARSKYDTHTGLNNQHNPKEPIWSFNEHENPHEIDEFEEDIHMSYEKYEESDYMTFNQIC